MNTVELYSSLKWCPQWVFLIGGWLFFKWSVRLLPSLVLQHMSLVLQGSLMCARTGRGAVRRDSPTGGFGARLGSSTRQSRLYSTGQNSATWFGSHERHLPELPVCRARVTGSPSCCRLCLRSHSPGWKPRSSWAVPSA